MKKAKNSIFYYLFVDNDLFVLQEKSLITLNSHLFCNYNVMFSLFDQFSLIIEYGKTEIFHFSKIYEVFNPSLLNLSTLEGSILHSKKHGIILDLSSIEN